MKARVAFSMLNFAKCLKAAGVPPQIAEAQAQATLEVIVGLLDENLATRQDFLLANKELMLVKSDIDAKLEGLETRINAKLESLEARIDAKIENLEARIDAIAGNFEIKLSSLETRLTLRLSVIMGGLVSTINIISHFFH